MARIDWALACDLAFFDRHDRLCLVGVTSRLPVPRLPLAINQLMLVARLVELRSVEEFEVSVAVLGPSGLWTTPTNGHGVAIEMAGEYVLITLREIPLVEEGVYGFQISLGDQEPASIDIPVLTVGSSRHAEVHEGSGPGGSGLGKFDSRKCHIPRFHTPAVPGFSAHDAVIRATGRRARRPPV